MAHEAKETRYSSMRYNRCGRSGFKLPALSLGLWHNFGGVDPYANSRALVLAAFDLGITHFDLANNYGPPPGSAEEILGRVLAQDLMPYRDELVVSTEEGLLQALAAEQIGCIAFSPLAQGMLTDKYLGGIPDGSRASKPHGALKPAAITEERLAKVRALNELAKARGQTLAQLALAWVLRHPGMTSALIGASVPAQLEDAVAVVNNLSLSAGELQAIEDILR
jgi:aryl-alcohol dehydrogenase-like predicted oxidoreductase